LYTMMMRMRTRVTTGTVKLSGLSRTRLRPVLRVISLTRVLHTLTS